MEKIDDPKGEYVIIVEGADKSKQEQETETLNNMTLDEHFLYYEKKGLDKKEIIKRIAKDRGVSKNVIYQKFI